MLEQLTQQLSVLQWAEFVALSLSVAYVILAAKKSQWCWAAAAISTAIYTVLFWHVSLVSESFLNAYYLVMAGWGWWSWRRQDEARFVATMRTLTWHIFAILGCSIIAIAWGYAALHLLAADYAFLDALTTVFALFTTWMLTQRIRENWLYWIVIDVISIGLYQAKGLYITSLLMVFYTVMAVVGWYSWKYDDERIRPG